VHPERVANKVASLPGMNEIDIAAAFCHDVLEDCDPRYEAEILEQCGQEVLDLVKELTWPTDLPKNRLMPRAEKNKIRFAKAKEMSDRAKRIKLADRLDNLKDMGNAPRKYLQKYLDESRQLVSIIGKADEKLANEIKKVIGEIARAKGNEN